MPRSTPGRRALRAEPPPRRSWARPGKVAAGLTATLVGLALAVAAAVGVGPSWCDQAAAAVLSTTIVSSLAARTGGRTWIFGGLALVVAVTTVVSDSGVLRAGAAALTAVATGVLAVMLTVPAPRFRLAVREVGVATAVSVVGALAVVGFRPTVATDAFDYVALGLAFALTLVLVYRLAAGFNSLGRRGLIVVIGGAVAVVVVIAYAELLRRYGPPGLLDRVFDAVRWHREHMGAVPRPTVLFIGAPALVWGTHMRARRRQGWWVTAFGVCLTVSFATVLMNPETGWLEAALILFYSLPPGLLLGYIAIRLDLALTGPRGRRARRDEEARAVRPEAGRFHALL